MEPPANPVVMQMQQYIQRWEQVSDRRALFLNCYLMMTRNMLAALDRCEFLDPPWVRHLLEHFASYYFVSLQAYETLPGSAPRVWQLAHDSTRDSGAMALQNLLLGVNAHINYDLVLTLADVLREEWPALAEDGRSGRYRDYCFVNDIIGRTIDAVQDQILETAMPVMDLVDRLFGPVDEWLISMLIQRWREDVWHFTVRLLDAGSPEERQLVVREVEANALNVAGMIALKRF